MTSILRCLNSDSMLDLQCFITVHNVVFKRGTAHQSFWGLPLQLSVLATALSVILLAVL